MRVKPLRIENYRFAATDQLFLDANVWLFLYCPHGDPNAHGPMVYSAAFKRILEAKSKIHISIVVLGEFINRYCRLAHALLVAKNAAVDDFKRFRKTAPFKQVAKASTDAAKRILKDARPITDGFSALKVGEILADFETGKRDFNDLLIADLCRRENFVLITDDEDFGSESVPILTANAVLAK